MAMEKNKKGFKNTHGPGRPPKYPAPSCCDIITKCISEKRTNLNEPIFTLASTTTLRRALFSSRHVNKDKQKGNGYIKITDILSSRDSVVEVTLHGPEDGFICFSDKNKNENLLIKFSYMLEYSMLIRYKNKKFSSVLQDFYKNKLKR